MLLNYILLTIIKEVNNMKNKIRSYLVNIIALLTPYLVRTVTSFIKYGVICCIILFAHSMNNGYLTISGCCWIIIVSGIIIELTKIIIGKILSKSKEDKNG